MADPKLVFRKVGGGGRSPFPAEMRTLLSACREALSLVVTTRRLTGILVQTSFFIAVRLIFFSFFFFPQPTNKPFSKGFGLISPPLLISLLVLFSQPADFSANPPLPAAVFPPSGPGCSGLPTSRGLGAAAAAHAGARSGPGDRPVPARQSPPGNSTPVAVS